MKIRALLMILACTLLNACATAPSEGLVDLRSACVSSEPPDDLALARRLDVDTAILMRMKQANGWTTADLCEIPVARLRRLVATASGTAVGATGGNRLREFRLLQQQDENGEVPADGLQRALRERAPLIDLRKMGDLNAGAWTNLGPSNISGRVNALAVDRSDPNHLIAASASGGLWSSNDRGLNWSSYNDFAASLSFSSLAQDPRSPQVFYAGSGEYFYTGKVGVGVLKSIHGGASWNALPATNPNSNVRWSYVNGLAVDPSNSQKLLAQNFCGVYASADGGNTWVPRFNPSTNGLCVEGWSVRFHPAATSRVIAGFGNGVVAVSGDAGTTWSQVALVPSTSGASVVARVEVAFAPSDPLRAYALTSADGGALYQSTDAGKTWSKVGSPGMAGDDAHMALWVDPFFADVVVVANIDAYRSIDGGRNWQKISDWVSGSPNLTSAYSAHADHHAIVEAGTYAQDRRVYFATDGGIYQADDIRGAATKSGWTRLSNNLNVTEFYTLAASRGDPTLIAGGAQDQGISLRPGGSTSSSWNWVFSGDGTFVSFDPQSPGILYASTQNLHPVRIESNPPAVFSLCSGLLDGDTAGCGGTSSTNFVAPLVVDPADANQLWAGGASLWLGTGIRGRPVWRAVKPRSQTMLSTGSRNWISAVAVHPTREGTALVGHNNGELYVSRNAKAASPVWTQIPGLPARMVTSLHFDPGNDLRVFAGFGGFSKGNVWLSEDGGVNWRDISANLPAVPVLAIAVRPTRPSTLYVGSYIGVFASDDVGSTWSAVSEGPATAQVSSLAFADDRTLLAASFGRGAWKFAFDPVLTPPATNHSGLWWNSPAGSEPGWGLNIAHQGDTLFASWFTYDLSGKGWWLVMTAANTGNDTFSGSLLSVRGPAFDAATFDPSQVVGTEVGTATLVFTGADSGTFAYTVNGISQTKVITREVFGPLPTCTYSAQNNAAAATNYQDLWWKSPAGSESGWGINLTHQGDTIFATWFTYDHDNSPMWLVATANKIGDRTYSGDLYRTTGPAFNAVPFRTAAVVGTKVGSATFTFSDGNNASFAYVVNGVSQTKPITREILREPGTVCSP